MKYCFYKDWIFINLFNLISFNWNRRKVLKSIEGVFIKRYFRFTKNYAPFMFCVHRGKLLSITIQDVEWKDKWDTPRHEENPLISIGIFNKFFFNWEWRLSKELESRNFDNEDYWEQILWYLYYSDKDINKAKETWPWVGEDNKSTWNDKFIEK